MPVEKVLVEIQTMANMAGLAEAKAGMLGLNAVNLAGGLALGALIVAGKSAVDITQEHAHAEANLATAIANRNAQVGKVPPPDPVAVKAVADATQAHADAVRQLKEMQVGANANHKISTLELMHLQDQQAKVRKTTDELTAAQARLTGGTQATLISTAKARDELTTFMQANRDYISNQNDVINGYASLVREGVPAAQIQDLMATALNISAVEGKTFTESVDLLQSAEAGRSKELKKLVGLTLETIPATATLAEKQAIIARNMDIVAQAYKDGTLAIDPLTVATNNLKTDWEQIAEKYGPHLVDEMATMAKSIDTNMPSWLTWLDTVNNIGNQLIALNNLGNKSTLELSKKTVFDFNAAPGSAGSQQYPHGVGTYTGPKGSTVGYQGQNDPLGTGSNRGQANDMHYQNERLAAIEAANKEALNNLRIIAANSKQRPQVNNVTVNSTNQSDAQIAAIIARNLRKIGQVN
jgi:hypothetical protein